MVCDTRAGVVHPYIMYRLTLFRCCVSNQFFCSPPENCTGNRSVTYLRTYIQYIPTTDIYMLCLGWRHIYCMHCTTGHTHTHMVPREPCVLLSSCTVRTVSCNYSCGLTIYIDHSTVCNYTYYLGRYIRGGTVSGTLGGV